MFICVLHVFLCFCVLKHCALLVLHPFATFYFVFLSAVMHLFRFTRPFYMQAFRLAHPSLSFEDPDIIVGKSGVRVSFCPERDFLVWLPHPALRGWYSCFAHLYESGSVYLGCYPSRLRLRPAATSTIPATDLPLETNKQ